MAGDCPHNAHLEATLKHYHDDSSAMVATHESYLKIIDDLKNDLEQISCEVIMVQKECSDQDINNHTADADLETSLKELETQNDRLEQALKLQTQTKDAALTELQTNNETLKCQIDHLKRTVFDREQHILQLDAKIKSISQLQANKPQITGAYGHSHTSCCRELEKNIEQLRNRLEKSSKKETFLHRETVKLTEELKESKRKNVHMISQSQRVASLLKGEKTLRLELASKYEGLEKSFEDQAKQLKAAKIQLSTLSERFQETERRQNEHTMERTLLHDEVLALKEKEAFVMGKQKSMQEQMLKIEKELYSAHDTIKEQQCTLQRTEFVHYEEIKRMQEANCDLKRKLANLIEDYKKLQEEYDKQKAISREHEKLIESFRKWKEMQMKIEAKTRDSFKEYENHIKLLLDEKQRALNNYRNLHKEYSMLEHELYSLKMCSFSVSNYNPLHTLSERTIADRLEVVRRTANRVLEQSSYLLKEEEPPPSRGDISTTGKSSEDTL